MRHEAPVCCPIRHYSPLIYPGDISCSWKQLHIRHVNEFFLIPVFGYFLLTIGYHPALHFRSFHRIGDYSYGLYIYAFPIQQLLLHKYPRPLFLFAAGYPLSLAAAVLSWHFVERPSLSLKGKMRRAETRDSPNRTEAVISPP